MLIEHFCLETFLCTKTIHKVLLHCRSRNKDNPLAIVQIKDNWTNLFKNSSTQPTRSLAFSSVLRSGLLLLSSSWLCFPLGLQLFEADPSTPVVLMPALSLCWYWYRAGTDWSSGWVPRNVQVTYVAQLCAVPGSGVILWGQADVFRPGLSPSCVLP